MKTNFGPTASLVQNIQSNKSRRAEIAAQRRALREEGCALRQEQRSARENFIREAMDSFLQDMEQNKSFYINGWGNYSHPFTKLVSRTWKGDGWSEFRIPSGAYKDAVKAYEQALIELKKTLVFELQTNADFREHIVRTSTLKNLDKVL